MKIAIHQPDYIPYIGYFYKISQCDIFTFLDDVKFSHNNMHHWNRIKTPKGELRLKIPMDYHSDDTIQMVRTKDELNWKQKHLKAMELNYTRAKYFKDCYPKFRELLSEHYTSLADMNITINLFICDAFGIKKEYIRSSTMNINTMKEDKIIDICQDLNGTEYISGNGAKAYQNEEHFTQRGIKLTYSAYQSIEYPQLWKEFFPYLSILDYIFNCGFDWSYIDKAVDRQQY